jgi:glutathione S-transferase
MKLYGVPLSQPFRSCAWAMLQHRVPFEVVMAVPGSSAKLGARAEPFKAMNPLGTIPLAQEDDGFTLIESPAILSYISESRDLPILPASTKQRAKVNAFMSWHHQGTRTLASLAVPFLRPDLAAAMTEEQLSNLQGKADKALETLDKVWLADSVFLAGMPGPTAADLLAYEEVAQLRPEYFNIQGIEWARYPNTERWIERMKELPHYEAVHVSLKTLGDLHTPNETPIAKRLGAATKAGLKAIAEAQASYSKD